MSKKRVRLKAVTQVYWGSPIVRWCHLLYCQVVSQRVEQVTDVGPWDREGKVSLSDVIC